MLPRQDRRSIASVRVLCCHARTGVASLLSVGGPRSGLGWGIRQHMVCGRHDGAETPYHVLCAFVTLFRDCCEIGVGVVVVVVVVGVVGWQSAPCPW